MIVKTKRESIAKRKDLGLNGFPEGLFSVKDLTGIETFFKSNPASEYIIRDPIHPAGKYFFVNSFNECKEKLSQYEELITLNVSWNEFKEDIVLLGDIKVKKSFGTEVVDLTARTDSQATHRNIYEEPEYNLHTNLEDDRLWKVPGFSKLINYIVEHELYDVVIEFIVYDCPVGIKKEKIVIAELRSDY